MRSYDIAAGQGADDLCMTSPDPLRLNSDDVRAEAGDTSLTHRDLLIVKERTRQLAKSWRRCPMATVSRSRPTSPSSGSSRATMPSTLSGRFGH